MIKLEKIGKNVGLAKETMLVLPVCT